MEILTFALIALFFFGALAVVLGTDSRPSEHEHLRNW
jgi:hypothetical protein